LYKLGKTNHVLRRSALNTTRWVRLNRHMGSRGWRRYCYGVVLGLPLDISEAGFVKGDFVSALKTQEYIAKEIKAGDGVDVVLTGGNGKYRIRHNGRVVGCLSESMYGELSSIVRESNPSSSAPPYLSPVHVSNIVTVTPVRFPDEAAPYFRESKFWLGLELTGFPKIDWRYTPPSTGYEA
jgi:hypothetical protein